MALLGKLAVAVVGDINALKTAFKDVKTEAGMLDNEIKKSGLGLTQIARYATVAGAAVVGAMGTMLVATAKSAEEIDLLAKRTGVSREELQGLAYAAKQEGTDIQALGTGLARLSRNMYDAAQGTGEAKNAFRDLGISVTDANGNLRGSGAVLIDLADRMAAMDDETAATALAMKVLGRGAQDLVPFLRMGGDEIRRLMDEARRLGYVMNDETIKQLEAFGDSIETFKTGLAGFKQKIAGDIVPYANQFLGILIDIEKTFHVLVVKRIGI